MSEKTDVKGLSTVSVDLEREGSIDRHVIATGFDDFNDKLDTEKYGETKRKLSNRHISFLAIGQSIGTGLYVGIKSPLMTSGSLSLFLGFVVWAGLNIGPLMLAVAEMCSYLPIKGSFLHFSARWIDPAMGFACSIIYIYTNMMFICVEATAFATVIGYWSDLNAGIFIAICLVSILAFTIFGVNWYGEVEFTSTMLKVLLIIGLMFLAFISMCGGNPRHDAYGFQHWKEGGLMKEYLVEGTTGRFLGFWNVMVYAAFACGGADMLALVSGEMSQPRKNMGIVARRSYFRIYLFYFGGIFFMNTLCSSIDPILIAATESNESGAAASPWIIGIKNVGIHGLDDLCNAIIMTAAWSCGMGFLYSSSRSIYSSALAGYVPRVFSTCLKNGCPIYCVIISILVGCLSFLSISNSTAEVFNWFINLATTGLLCAYIALWWCYFKFRKALKAQGKEQEFLEGPYYKMPKIFNPYLTYFGAGLNSVVLFFNGFWIFFPGQFSVANLFTSYFAPVFFLVLYFGWKIIKKTHLRTDLEADITTGKQEIDDEEEIERQYLDSIPKKEGFLWNVWYKITDVLFN